MSFFTNLAEKAFRVAGATEQKRQYSAAKNNRLVGDWNSQNQHTNQEIRQSITVLRARARQLSRDDDYAIGFLKKLESNVIGAKGIQVQVDAKNANGTKLKDLNKSVEEAFCLWGKKDYCDVTGQDSLRGLAALALRSLAVDGEFLVRLILDESSPFGLKLQFLDVDWLDEWYNVPQLPNGNRVIMSVEVDAYDKPVAYYLTNPRWNNISVPGTPVVPSSLDRLRIPAEQVIHRFIKNRPGQSRGVTWFHGAMLRLNMLNGYEEAELVGARVGASQMAFVSKTTDETGSTLGSEKANIDTEVSPGMVMELPAGYTVHEFSPTRPGSSYGDYTKVILRAIASGLGISYHSLTSDLESTSYSSIRAGTIDERDIWKILQGWMVEHFYQDIYEKWLMFNIQTALVSVPPTRIKDVKYPKWRNRGFDWVDPSKDTRADIEAIDRGIKTMTEVMAEHGKDFEEEMEQQAYEKEVIKKLSLTFNSPDYPIPADQQMELAKAGAAKQNQLKGNS